MDLKWCKKRFFVTSSPFFACIRFYTRLRSRLARGGGGVPHSDLKVGTAR